MIKNLNAKGVPTWGGGKEIDFPRFGGLTVFTGANGVSDTAFSDVFSGLGGHDSIGNCASISYEFTSPQEWGSPEDVCKFTFKKTYSQREVEYVFLPRNDRGYTLSSSLDSREASLAADFPFWGDYIEVSTQKTGEGSLVPPSEEGLGVFSLVSMGRRMLPSDRIMYWEPSILFVERENLRIIRGSTTIRGGLGPDLWCLYREIRRTNLLGELGAALESLNLGASVDFRVLGELDAPAQAEMLGRCGVEFCSAFGVVGQMLIAPKEAILFLSRSELHLGSETAGRLGKYIAQFRRMRPDVQIFLETNSEEILRAIAQEEDKNPEFAADLAAYIFTREQSWRDEVFPLDLRNFL